MQVGVQNNFYHLNLFQISRRSADAVAGAHWPGCGSALTRMRERIDPDAGAHWPGCVSAWMRWDILSPPPPPHEFLLKFQVCSCCKIRCTLQSIFQQPMMLETCFYFLNILAMAVTHVDFHIFDYSWRVQSNLYQAATISFLICRYFKEDSKWILLLLNTCATVGWQMCWIISVL